MDARLKMRVTIETLHELLDELDYYRLLKLDRSCTQTDISPAFRKASRRLHPDRMAALGDDAVKEKANAIYTLINEAFQVLRDPEKRRQYDQGLDQGELRFSEASRQQADQARKANDPEKAAQTPQAEKFWRMALRNWKDENYSGCVQNIKFALQFEPQNEVFQAWLKNAEAEAFRIKQANPYKMG
ncbi:MAG: DnaJ domain-containing protein [Myxococcota bacterium]